MPWHWDGALFQDDLLAREWTQLELAERARVTPSTVSRLLNGGSVSIKQARRVAKVFGRPVRHYRLAPEAAPLQNMEVSA